MLQSSQRRLSFLTSWSDVADLGPDIDMMLREPGRELPKPVVEYCMQLIGACQKGQSRPLYVPLSQLLRTEKELSYGNTSLFKDSDQLVLQPLIVPSTGRFALLERTRGMHPDPDPACALAASSRILLTTIVLVCQMTSSCMHRLK